jgi:hypothetical protein
MSRFGSVTRDGIWIGYCIYWHNSELQVITASSLISTLYNSLFQPLSLLQAAVSSIAVSWWRMFRWIPRDWTLSIPLDRRLFSASFDRAQVTLSIPLSWPGVLVIVTRGGPNRQHLFQQFFYSCYGRLPSDSQSIVDVFASRYQVTYVSSCDRCIATVIHATIFRSAVPQLPLSTG